MSGINQDLHLFYFDSVNLTTVKRRIIIITLEDLVSFRNMFHANSPSGWPCLTFCVDQIFFISLFYPVCPFACSWICFFPDLLLLLSLCLCAPYSFARPASSEFYNYCPLLALSTPSSPMFLHSDTQSPGFVYWTLPNNVK